MVLVAFVDFICVDISVDGIGAINLIKGESFVCLIGLALQVPETFCTVAVKNIVPPGGMESVIILLILKESKHGPF